MGKHVWHVVNTVVKQTKTSKTSQSITETGQRRKPTIQDEVN